MEEIVRMYCVAESLVFRSLAKIVHGDLVPDARIALPTMRETVCSWHDVATIWLPFLAKSEGLKVSVLMGKQHSPAGTR
jgi:hypothetical protein